MYNIFLLRFGKGQFFHDGPCHPSPFFSMANSTIGFILITSTDIVQVSGRQQHIHVSPFDGSDAFTQPVNPEGVIPFVAAPGTLEVFVSQLFYGVKHGVL